MITLFLMGEKGYEVLKNLCFNIGSSKIDCVISDRDGGVKNDFFKDIESFCKDNNIKFLSRLHAKKITWNYAFAIGWRWLISNTDNLIVLHDSLLPKYRGFSPVVSALINGELKIGVTAIYASKKYDEGDIISYRELLLPESPKIGNTIKMIIPLYCELVNEISFKLICGQKIDRHPQEHEMATYSLWRDHLDYQINWAWPAEKIKRFIDSVGAPYLGATTTFDGRLVHIMNVEYCPGYAKIENAYSVDVSNSYGKIFEIKDGYPIVFCNGGLLKIVEMTGENGSSLLPIINLKNRFK